MGAFVILRHDTPDGAHHFDLMLQRAPGEPLATFRTLIPLHEHIARAEPASLDLEQIGDHREAYLTFEGELSGGRGRVARLAAGEAGFLLARPDRLVVSLAVAACRGRLTLARRGDRWQAVYAPVDRIN